MGTGRNFHHRTLRLFRGWKPNTRLGAAVVLGGLGIGTAMVGNLLLTLLDTVGVHQDKLGDSTTKLTV